MPEVGGSPPNLDMGTHTVKLRRRRDGTYTLEGLLDGDLSLLNAALDLLTDDNDDEWSTWVAEWDKLLNEKAAAVWGAGPFTVEHDMPWVDS